MAYDNSVVERYAGGGWGFFTTGAAAGPDNGRTWIAHSARIAARNFDTVSKIRMLVKREGTASALGVKFKIFTYDGTTYTVLHDIDVTTAFNDVTSGSYQTLEVEGEWFLSTATAGYGYYLGMYMEEVNNSSWGAKSVGAGVSDMKWVSADVTTTQLASGMSTWDDGFIISMECFVNNNDMLAYEVSTDSEGNAISNGDRITIPYWTTEPCYIILEDVTVPDGEDLDIVIEINSLVSGSKFVLQTVTINFDGGANDQRITDKGFSAWKSIAGGEGDNYRIYIWLDQANNKTDTLFENTDDGMGPLSNDRKILSMNDRAVGSMDFSDNVVRRVHLSQNTGTGAEIGKIIVCRKPILAVGDSNVSALNLYELAGVGAILDNVNVFTEQRYVINAGMQANRVREDQSTVSTSMWQRWNDVQNNQDLCSFKDVVVCLVNPGTNDIAAINSDSAVSNQTVPGVSGGIGQIVGQAIDSDDVFGRTNDVIMCGIIPQPDGTALEQAAVQAINEELRRIAFHAGVPFASMDGFDLSWYTDSPRIHPDGDGTTFITDRIVAAYEGNLVPSSIGGTGKPNSIYNSAGNSIYPG